MEAEAEAKISLHLRGYGQEKIYRSFYIPPPHSTIFALLNKSNSATVSIGAMQEASPENQNGEQL
jgi:hypothetical protein